MVMVPPMVPVMPPMVPVSRRVRAGDNDAARKAKNGNDRAQSDEQTSFQRGCYRHAFVIAESLPAVRGQVSGERAAQP
jgi:hypothetical protein